MLVINNVKQDHEAVMRQVADAERREQQPRQQVCNVWLQVTPKLHLSVLCAPFGYKLHLSVVAEQLREQQVRNSW